MAPRTLQTIETNGMQLRTVVEGDGPLVVLLHGFPQCWYLWRNQIDPLVAAGYRVAVPDQRGYGQSSAPPEISDYNIRELCADIDGLAKALGHDEFTVVGHDWGCLVAWNTALLHPDTCKAVMGISVPFWRFGPESVNPPGMDDQFWYIRYFQKPGVAEAEFEADLERTLRTFYVGASGDAEGNFMDQLKFPKTTPMLQILPPPPETLPSWLSRADLDYYLEEYRASGFRGPINWYRNIPNNNALTPELDGARFTQPAAFAAGTADPVLLFDPNWRERFEAAFDDLRFLEMIEGAGHWVQQEKAEETTASILRFLQGL